MYKIEIVVSENLLKTSKTSNTVQKKTYIIHKMTFFEQVAKKKKVFWHIESADFSWRDSQDNSWSTLSTDNWKRPWKKKRFAGCEKHCNHCSVTDDDHKSRAYRYTRVRKHAVRRQSWFTGTILTWCWANTQSYLQLVRTDSSPNIDFSAQTPDKQSLCGWQIAIIIQKKKRKEKKITDAWFSRATLKRFHRHEKSIRPRYCVIVDECTMCGHLIKRDIADIHKRNLTA